MKKIFLLSASFAICVFAFSQDAAPAAVIKTFDDKYPGVTNKEWELEDGNYEVEFIKDGKEISVLIDPSGTWISTESAITFEQLPAAVQQVLKDNFSGYKVIESSEITFPSGPKNYEVEMSSGQMVLEVVFDPNGKPLSRKIEEEEKEEEDEYDDSRG